MRTHPFNRQALSIPKADSSRKNGKVVSPIPPPLPLFYYITNLLLLGEGIQPPRPSSPFQEIRHYTRARTLPNGPRNILPQRSVPATTHLQIGRAHV